MERQIVFCESTDFNFLLQEMGAPGIKSTPAYVMITKCSNPQWHIYFNMSVKRLPLFRHRLTLCRDFQQTSQKQRQFVHL